MGRVKNKILIGINITSGLSQIIHYIHQSNVLKLHDLTLIGQ